MSTAMILGIIISGICTGGLYGLASAAFSFQYGSLRIVNFAYGSFIMIGMFITYSLIRDKGMHPLLFFVIFVALFFIIGVSIRSFFLKSKDNHVHIIVTTGISLFIENLALFIWGSFPRTLIESIPPTWKIKMSSGILVINKISVLTLIVSAIVLIGFSVFLKSTWLGMTIRAVVQQRETAYLMGIDSMKVINIGFGVSMVMLSIASLMIALQFTIEPSAGSYYQLIGFLVCLVAGMGNMKGAFLAGILIGIVSTIINMFAAPWHDPIIFITFVVVLTFFPNGLFISKKSISRSV